VNTSEYISGLRPSPSLALTSNTTRTTVPSTIYTHTYPAILSLSLSLSLYLSLSLSLSPDARARAYTPSRMSAPFLEDFLRLARKPVFGSLALETMSHRAAGEAMMRVGEVTRSARANKQRVYAHSHECRSSSVGARAGRRA